MKNILKLIATIFCRVFGEWFPAFLQMSTGAIGKLLDTLGYAKAIILAAFALIAAAIKWIRSRRNR